MRALYPRPSISRPAFPRGPLLGVGAVIVLTIFGAAIARLQGGPVPEPTTTAAMFRDIRFQDEADGRLIATDAHDGTTLGVVAPGTNGFIRATMRGLGRTRRMEGLGPDMPFRLTAWRDGRLTLDDPATGRRIDLEAFGTTNQAAFASLLTPTLTSSGRTQP